jgi:hypothetical protein
VEDGKIGPTFSEIFQQGVQTLRDANEGKMAMDAPPIEAPVQSWTDIVQTQRETAPVQEQEVERSR